MLNLHGRLPFSKLTTLALFFMIYTVALQRVYYIGFRRRVRRLYCHLKRVSDYCRNQESFLPKGIISAYLSETLYVKL